MKEKTFIFTRGEFILSPDNPGETEREKGVWVELEPFVDEYFFPDSEEWDCGEEDLSADIAANREFFSRKEEEGAGVEKVLDEISWAETASLICDFREKAEKIFFPDGSKNQKVCVFSYLGQIFFSFVHRKTIINLEVENGGLYSALSMVKEVDVSEGEDKEIHFHLLRETGETLMSTRIARELIES